MPEPMTAKDLHDLVAPLWEAVPETVPTRLWFGAMSRLLWNDTHGRHEWERVGWCTDGEAEVYIIHAIEEWVLGQKNDLYFYPILNGEWSAQAGFSFEATGPTRLHALVRLAMCIHEDNPITTGDAGKEKR